VFAVTGKPATGPEIAPSAEIPITTILIIVVVVLAMVTIVWQVRKR
jgi:hypothetical protein